MEEASLSILIGFIMTYLVVIVLVLAFMIITMWFLYAKANKPGWAALIPIYNGIVFLQIAQKPGWWIILFLIPYVNIVFAIIATVNFCKAYGKSGGYAVGAIFLPVIFYPILAFGSAKYIYSNNNG